MIRRRSFNYEGSIPFIGALAKSWLMICAFGLFSVNAGGDRTPPEIEDLIILQDCGTSHCTVVGLRVTDDLSGIGGAWDEMGRPVPAPQAYFLSPSGHQQARAALDAWGTCGCWNLPEGFYSLALNMPTHPEAGTWALDRITAVDGVGNGTTLFWADCQARGWPTTFEVVGDTGGDWVGPEVTSLEIVTDTVESSPTGTVAKVIVGLRDNGAGLMDDDTEYRALGSINFHGPSGESGASGEILAGRQLTGDWTAGTFEVDVVLPAHAPPGTWTFTGIFCYDLRSNTTSVSVQEALTLGWPWGFTVVGSGDTEPPVVQSLEIEPGMVDVSDGPQRVEVTVRITEDLSGFIEDATGGSRARCSFGFAGPSATQGVGGNVWPWERVSGDALDGVYRSTFVVQRFSRSGIWSLAYLNVVDAVGNEVRWTGPQLAAQGLSPQLIVHCAPDLRVYRPGESVLVSWPAEDTNYTLEATTTVGDPESWQELGVEPAVIGQRSVVAIPNGGKHQLFRMRRSTD